jgi:hypothetical protein
MIGKTHLSSLFLKNNRCFRALYSAWIGAPRGILCAASIARCSDLEVEVADSRPPFDAKVVFTREHVRFQRQCAAGCIDFVLAANTFHVFRSVLLAEAPDPG